MTILSLIQNTTDELAGIARPASVYGSTDVNIQRLTRFMYRTLKDIRQFADFPQTQKEASITLVADQANYALPSDFERFLFETHWDGSNHWPLTGPLSAGEWQAVKRGISSTTPRKLYRVKGYGTNQIYLHPTPSTGDAGDLLYYEYISTVSFLPKLWTASTVFAANAYCSYNGNVYQTTSSGTTGSTPPTHTSSSASDGGVTWNYVSTPYLTITADTDFCVINEDLVVLGIVWRWLRQNGFDYQEQQAEFYNALEKECSGYTSARTVDLTNREGFYSIGYNNIPDSGYGG